MELEISYSQPVIIVKPLLEIIDARISTDFTNKLISLTDQNEPLLLLNLVQVDFIDSSALGSIIFVFKNITNNKGLLSLCEIRTPILNLLKVTRLDQVFDIRSNQQDSITFLTSRRKI